MVTFQFEILISITGEQDEESMHVWDNIYCIYIVFNILRICRNR